jgi:hypothetical protein
MNDVKLKITISVDPGLLRRIDAVAEVRGDSRSALMERMLFDSIEDQEEFLDRMEKPIPRAVVSALISSPVVMRAIASIAGKTLTDEELKRLQERAPVHAAKGKERQSRKRGQGGSPAIEGA